jgi:outer membrane immunogenic protein
MTFASTIKKTAIAGAMAVAALLPANAADPGYRWQGLYIGGLAGYVWTHNTHCDESSGAIPNCGPSLTGVAFPNYDLNGAAWGATIGYNFQVQQWVIGIEADYSWTNLDGSSPSIAGAFGCGAAGELCVSSLDGIGTVRGRLGYSFGHVLPFVTAGVAFTRLSAGIRAGGAFESSDSDTQTSFVLGGGMEIALTDNWSLKGEYLHIFKADDFKYDVLNACGTPGCFLRQDDIQVFRVGINYRFGWREAAPLK